MGKIGRLVERNLKVSIFPSQATLLGKVHSLPCQFDYISYSVNYNVLNFLIAKGDIGESRDSSIWSGDHRLIKRQCWIRRPQSHQATVLDQEEHRLIERQCWIQYQRLIDEARDPEIWR